jgi:hypothetical protein
MWFKKPESFYHYLYVYNFQKTSANVMILNARMEQLRSVFFGVVFINILFHIFVSTFFCADMFYYFHARHN